MGLSLPIQFLLDGRLGSHSGSNDSRDLSSGISGSKSIFLKIEFMVRTSRFSSFIMYSTTFFFGSFFSGLGILVVLPFSEPNSLRSILGPVSP